MMTSRQTCLAGLLLSAVLAALPARAQEVVTQSTINDDALRDIAGVALINQSAGDGNQQLNSAALAVNATGLAVAFTAGAQHTDPAPTDVELDAFAVIDDDAFANARGLVSVSQASGIGNQQINFASLAVGVDVSVLAEAELSQSRTGDPPPADAEPEGARLTHIDDRAFLDASGVIQVNQVAGVSNNTFNRFALTMSAN